MTTKLCEVVNSRAIIDMEQDARGENLIEPEKINVINVLRTYVFPKQRTDLYTKLDHP